MNRKSSPRLQIERYDNSVSRSVAPFLTKRRAPSARPLAPILGLALLICSLLLPATSWAAERIFGEQQNPNAGFLARPPRGVAVDPSNGDLYVGAGFGHKVSKFTSEGSSIFAYGYGILNGEEEEQICTTTCVPWYSMPFRAHSAFGPMLDQAEAVAVDPTTGDFYVTDSGHNRVLKFTSAGHFLFAFGGDVVAHGPDNSSKNEVDKLIVKAEGGTYRLRFKYPYAEAFNTEGPSQDSGDIPYNATAAEVEAALDAVGALGGEGGSATVTGGPGDATGSSPYEITFENNAGGDDVHLSTIYSHEGQFGTEYTLTGGQHVAEVERVVEGGGAERCLTSLGDVCKAGGNLQSGIDGTFIKWTAELPHLHDQIAVGPTGTVYVGDHNRIETFNPEGQYIGQVDAPGLGNVQSVAVDELNDVYAIGESSSGVFEYNSIGSLLRTLHPAGEAQHLAVDGANDVYIASEIEGHTNEASYAFVGYKADGSLFAKLQSPLVATFLERGDYFSVGGIAVGESAGYLYATNYVFAPEEHGRVIGMSLPEPGPPLVKEQEVSDIEPTTATLHAEVNPEAFDTEYRFEYITASEYQADGSAFGAGTAATSWTDLGLVSQNNPVQAAVSSLSPATDYRWRAVAKNSEGLVNGAVQAFRDSRSGLSQGTDDSARHADGSRTESRTQSERLGWDLPG